MHGNWVLFCRYNTYALVSFSAHFFPCSISIMRAFFYSSWLFFSFWLLVKMGNMITTRIFDTFLFIVYYVWRIRNGNAIAFHYTYRICFFFFSIPLRYCCCYRMIGNLTVTSEMLLHLPTFLRLFHLRCVVLVWARYRDENNTYLFRKRVKIACGFEFHSFSE